jgi:MoxR-like ATPase
MQAMTKKMKIEDAKKAGEKIIQETSKVYVGDEFLLTKVVSTTLAGGHILFEDYPGLGKTLLAKVIAILTGCRYSRVQFTPDVLPSDILGIKVWRQRDGSFELMKGPIFTNILLADEINRSPPKTQSALLEAMEERQTTIEGETFALDPPFIVLATQNPIEYEGTYPLPEAQMDRFLIRLSMGYARDLKEEAEILKRRIEWRSDDPTRDLKPVISKEIFLELMNIVENQIYVDKTILEYISQIVRGTREHPKVEVGSSPRGGLSLLKVSRAIALLRGRDFVTPDDVKDFAVDALSHRIILKVENVLEGDAPAEVIHDVLKQVSVPTDYRPR